MTGKRSPRKPRPRITDQQISDMMRLRRQGKSISAIAQATGCNRQTVRVYLKERRGDILTDEVRKQLLTGELEKHFNDLTEFAVSYKSYLTIPSSPTEDRDAATVLEPLLGKELAQGLDLDSLQARREQRQMNRRNKMLLLSLREHTREKGWWQAFEEWREAWNTCVNAFRELRGEANEVAEKLINEKPSLKEEAERRIKEERDTVGSIAGDMLRVVLWAGTGDKPVEEYKFRGEEDRVVTVLSDGSHYFIGRRLSEVSLSQDMAAVCELVFKTMCPSFSDKGIPEMLHRMDEKIEVIDDALDPFILRPLLVRTRCTLCPV